MFTIKSIVLAVALTATGAAFSAVIPEGSYPQIPAGSNGKTRAEVSAEAARFNEAGRPGLIRGEQRPEFVPAFAARPQNRAEVDADLELWQRAGLAAASRGEATPDLQGSDYQAQLAAYRGLRNGPAYAELVRRLAGGNSTANRAG